MANGKYVSQEEVNDLENTIRNIRNDLSANQNEFQQQIKNGVMTFLPNGETSGRPNNGLILNGQVLAKKTRELVQLESELITKQNMIGSAKDENSRAKLNGEVTTLKEKVEKKKAEYQSVVYTCIGYFQTLKANGIINPSREYAKSTRVFNEDIRCYLRYYSKCIIQQIQIEKAMQSLRYKQELLDEQEHKKKK